MQESPKVGLSTVSRAVLDDDRAVANAGLLLPATLAERLELEALCDQTVKLRTGQTETVLGHRAMAPSTIGTFLRRFSFGQVRQLDRMSELALTRAWAAGPDRARGR